MPRQPDGRFVRTNGNFQGATVWQQQSNSQDKTISSSRHDTHDEDIGQGLEDSLSRSGKGGMLADLNLGNFSLLNGSDTAGNNLKITPKYRTTSRPLTAQAALRQGYGDITDPDYGAVGDDSTDNQAAINNAMANNGAIHVPKGTFRASPLTIPAGGMTIEGQGQDSILKVSNINQVLMQMSQGSKLRLYNIRLVGDGTATASTNGIGLLTERCSDIELDTVWFEQFGFAGWSCTTGANPATTRIRGRNITCLDMKDGAGTNSSRNLRFRGALKDLQLENLFLEASSTNPASTGLFISQDQASENWEGISVKTITVRGGHVGWGIVYSTETGGSGFESGKASLIDAKVYSTARSAFKSKGIDRLQISNFYAESCDSSPEDPGNLQGTLLINGAEDFQGENIQVHSTGTDGIRIFARAGGTAAGIGRAKRQLNNFICSGAGEAGVYVGHSTQDLVMTAPILYDCSLGIDIRATTGLEAPKDITIIAPHIRRTTGNSPGINVAGLSGLNVGAVTVDSPNIKECGGFGIVSNYCDQLQVNGGTIRSNGSGGVNEAGIRAANTVVTMIDGTRITENPFAVSFNAGDTDVSVKNCDLRGNTTGIWQNTVAPSGRFDVSSNLGWLEGSQVYDPPSLAAGASVTETVTVTDARLGDVVTGVSFSLDTSSIVLSGVVRGNDLVRVTLKNEGASAVNLGSGTLKVTVAKVS